MRSQRRAIRGWTMVGVGSVCYGFGISPMYYGWGFFLPEMRQEFALSDTQAGLVFSVFSYLYHLLGPVVGFAMGRWGIRSMMGFGSVVGVAAFLLMSRADSFVDCLLAYGVLGGIAIGFSTILPAQTLASNWFVRYRARALATVLAGGAVAGFVVNKYFGPWILANSTWRTGWLVIAGTSAVVALIALVFIRGRPEDVDQGPDGEPLEERPPEVEGHGIEENTADGQREGSSPTEWTATQAIKSYQFYVLVGLSIAYGVPWGVISVYGRLHLEAIGFTTAMAGSILGVRVLVSLLGRISALGGDFVAPQTLLGAVLIIEAAGSAGLVVARTPGLAYFCVCLIGIGFGAAYVSVPVAYSAFYGRQAFGATVGTRLAITGLVAPAAPTVAGMLSDWSGSYALPFLIMASLCFLGGLTAFWLPAPGRVPVQAQAT